MQASAFEQPGACKVSPNKLYNARSDGDNFGSSPTCSNASFSQRLSHRTHRGRIPFVIGVAGGSASGKTTVCDTIMNRLNDDSYVVFLSQDSFYRVLSEEERKRVKEFNFDTPQAFDEEAILYTLQELKAGRAVDIPVYDFTRSARTSEKQRVEPADVIILEGILVLHMERIRAHLNMKVFVDTDDDVRLARRIQRDVAERGRDVGGVIEQYTRFVKPAFDQYIGPSRRFADIIIPFRGHNTVAIDVITEHIRTKLQQHDLRRVYPNLHVLPSTYQIRGMHTIIRDRNTTKNDFSFFADRLIRLVVEAGLGHLPFAEKSVITPAGHTYVGVEFGARKICGVSLVRSGEAMENALRACCEGVKIGKILVDRTSEDIPPLYVKLPHDIADRWVLLMDPILSTGTTALTAIRTLLEQGVDESKIVYLTIIAAPDGVHKVCSTFPRVVLVTSEIDDGMEPGGQQVIPGIGSFGNRYFCD